MTSRKRITLLLTAMALIGAGRLVPASADSAPAHANGIDVPVIDGDIVRSYRLYVPPSPTARVPTPLVIVLHGLGLSSASVESDSQFDAAADTGGFAVAYPQGINGEWNAGACCRSAAKNKTDDVGFLLAVISSVSTVLPVDSSRIYLAGFSNGGMLALRAGCEHPEVFAAVAAIAGTLESPCQLTRPQSILELTGADDHTVPYSGLDYSTFLEIALPSIPSTVGRFENQDACSGLAQHSSSPALTIRRYDTCWAHSSVEMDYLPRAAHFWPSVANSGVDATARMWSFFSAKSLVATPGRRPQATIVTRLSATDSVVGSKRQITGVLDGRYDLVAGTSLRIQASETQLDSTTTDFDGHFSFMTSTPGLLRLFFRTPAAPGSSSTSLG